MERVQEWGKGGSLQQRLVLDRGEMDFSLIVPLLLTRMFFWGLVLLGLSQGGATEQEREERSLANTFPFNGIDEELPERDSRQGLDNSVSSIPFSDVASSYAGGKR